MTLPDRDHVRAGLDAAMAAGVIDRDTAERLAPYFHHQIAADPHPDPDDEKLRLVTGFNDIFVTIGLAMFLGALGYLLSGQGAAVVSLVTGAAAWGLAEYFTRARRMALPSIVLLLVFAVSVFRAVASALSGSQSFLGDGLEPLHLIAAGAVTAIATALHWMRFRVPITVAAGAGAVAVILVALITQAVPDVLDRHAIAVFVPLGFGIFALAMWFDMSDRLRQTRRTDIAFWLHLLAAPIIVHPILMTVSGASGTSANGALLVVAVFTGLSIVALVVDRRAILVSSLTYLAYAAGTLMTAAGLESSSFAMSVLAVGAVVLMLSAAWRPLRRAFVGLLPAALRNRVPVVV